MNKVILILTSLAVHALVACNDTEFQAYTGEKNGSQADPNPSSSPNTSTQNPGGDTIYPGTNTNNPNNDGNTLKGWDIEWGSLVKSYHLGDNNKSDTSCKLKVSTNTLDGKALAFNFYVQNDNTQADVIVYHCGVDEHFANMHRVSIYNPMGQSVLERTLTTSTNLLFMEKQTIVSRMTFSRGSHKIRVQTTLLGNDYDDFSVRIKLMNATGPLTLGAVVPENI